jgi:hypothetical protein
MVAGDEPRAVPTAVVLLVDEGATSSKSSNLVVHHLLAQLIQALHETISGNVWTGDHNRVECHSMAPHAPRPNRRGRAGWSGPPHG